YNRSKQTFINYNLYRADMNGTLVGDQRTGAGRELLPLQYYSIAGGPVGRPLFDPFAESVTIDGINYIRRSTNDPDPASVTPENPLGLRSEGGTYTLTVLRQKGIYLVNYSKWMAGRLSTLM